MSEKNQLNRPADLMHENNYAYYPQTDAQGKPMGLTLVVHVEATEKGYFVSRDLVSEQESRAMQERFSKAGGKPVNVELQDVMEYAEGHGMRFTAKSLNEKGEVVSHERPFDEDYAERAAEEMIFESDPVRQISKNKEGMPMFSAVTYEIEDGALKVADKTDSTIAYNKDTQEFDVVVNTKEQDVPKKSFDMNSLELENQYQERDRIELAELHKQQKANAVSRLKDDKDQQMMLGAQMNRALEDELDLEPGEKLKTAVYDPEFVDQVTYQQMEKERDRALDQSESFGDLLLESEKQIGHREDDEPSLL